MIRQTFGSIKSSLIITAATIGSGVFALPYVIAQAGWLVTLGYFVVLGAVVITAHAIYLKTLAAEGEKVRLLGLARKYFGAPGFWFGFVGIVVGLLLSFVIFLILGTQFVQLLFPTLPHAAALFIFWLLLAIPALTSNRRQIALARAGVISIATVIIIIFTASFPPCNDLAGHYMIVWRNVFLPFGAVLFMLAGWTGIEPFYEEADRDKRIADRIPALAVGTGIAVLLYWMFAAGILGSAPHIAADTASGLMGWPIWKKDLIAVFGLFAVGTVAIPISHEIRNALENDLRWNHAVSRVAIVGLPIVAVLAGFNDFLLVVSLSGGLFIGMQYLLIVAVARRALRLSAVQKFWLDVIAIVFVLAAVYEIATFVIQ
jgi:amino acid permease